MLEDLEANKRTEKELNEAIAKGRETIRNFNSGEQSHRTHYQNNGA